jgi:hypothetical protein
MGAAMSGLSMAQLLAHGFVRHLHGLFSKASPTAVVFTKTGAGTASLLAGTYIDVAGVLLSFPTDTAIVMPTLTPGTDYAIYACTDGTVRADASTSAPTGYTTANSRMIGGFHYSLVAAGTTVAGGSFATTGSGMIWTQTDVDNIAGINKYSFWDLKFRPSCDPRGMSLQPSGFWADLYFCSTDVDANGTSKAGTNVASGTVLPKIPLVFGGNGSTTYSNMTWWVANELAASAGKGLMTEAEFVQAAYGVTENQSLGGAASTIPSTVRQPGYTSRRGLEQASGHHWTWGMDSNFNSTGTGGFAWQNVNGGRGQMYLNNTLALSRVLLGGTRGDGSTSGSRASYWGLYPWFSSWTLGLRARGDHLVLA